MPFPLPPGRLRAQRVNPRVHTVDMTLLGGDLGLATDDPRSSGQEVKRSYQVNEPG